MGKEFKKNSQKVLRKESRWYSKEFTEGIPKKYHRRYLEKEDIGKQFTECILKEFTEGIQKAFRINSKVFPEGHSKMIHSRYSNRIQRIILKEFIEGIQKECTAGVLKEFAESVTMVIRNGHLLGVCLFVTLHFRMPHLHYKLRWGY